ncbi:MAG: microviridin/marinostatin family tricyclic proteinase inhibitor [Phycisphaerales bacterium]|nr:microviridin/marinostatin family tricyclic proteinase inhibitor [Phycisphaerales bacterium]
MQNDGVKKSTEKKDAAKEVPFFARYLEGQFPRVRTGVKSGGLGPVDPPLYQTQKWPSDGDDEIPPWYF